MTAAPRHSALTFVVGSLLTVGFAGCFGKTHSLNTPAANGGEEGEGTLAGMGGSAAGKTGKAGKAGSAAMVGPAGSAGKSSGHAAAAGSSGASVGAGPSAGGSTAGSAGNGVGETQQGGSDGSAGGPEGGVGNGGFGGAGFPGGGGDTVHPSAGSAGIAGGPGECTTDGAYRCPESRLCIAHPYDDCDPDTGCPGDCALNYRFPPCDPSDPTTCPGGLACIPDPVSLGVTPPEIDNMCAGPELPSCSTSADCHPRTIPGYPVPVATACVATPSGKGCLPIDTQCGKSPDCDGPVPECPLGYSPAIAKGCEYVCIPSEHCLCESYSDCVSPAVCDQGSKACRLPRSPAPRCSQPFDEGPCTDIVPVFAFIGNHCQTAVYGGCGGNDNRFSSIDDCRLECEGIPLERECPAGKVDTGRCIECDLNAPGLCALYENACIQTCTKDEDCAAEGDGVKCRYGICEVDCGTTP